MDTCSAWCYYKLSYRHACSLFMLRQWEKMLLYPYCTEVNRNSGRRVAATCLWWRRSILSLISLHRWWWDSFSCPWVITHYSFNCLKSFTSLVKKAAFHPHNILLFFISESTAEVMYTWLESNRQYHLMFRVVFWNILPCKMIVDRRFRGA
jgi:hypothetical protein